MCGIFGGFGISVEETKNAINLIKKGEDGITVKNLSTNIVFAARRHLVKKSGNENYIKMNEASIQNWKNSK